jgi:hypothetical protein
VETVWLTTSAQLFGNERSVRVLIARRDETFIPLAISATVMLKSGGSNASWATTLAHKAKMLNNGFRMALGNLTKWL